MGQAKDGDSRRKTHEGARLRLRSGLMSGIYVLLTVKHLMVNYDRKSNARDTGNRARRYYENKNLANPSPK